MNETAVASRRPSVERGSRGRENKEGQWRLVLGRRVRLLRLALVLAVLVVAARLMDVQLLHSGHYQQEATQELAQPVTIPALRGTITDRNGATLMAAIPTRMVIADDFQISHPVQEARALAPLIGVDVRRLVPLLSERSGYVPLVVHLPVARAAKVASLAFPGVTEIDNSVNVAPAGDLVSPIVGGINAAGQGDAGLESQYNALLGGHSGHETLLESPIGVQLPGTAAVDATSAASGTGLQLTLDEPLQYEVQQDLAKEMLTAHATGGEAVVMNVHTGQILAMVDLVRNARSAKAAPGAAHPGASTVTAASTTSATSAASIPVGANGTIGESPTATAITRLYEPGSVFKLVTFSAALADGVISPGSTFTVADQRVIDGDVFHDATPHPTVQMTATQILAESSNIGTSEIAQKLGEPRLLGQVRHLGFGTTTGLEFPGESPGLVVTKARWSTTDYVSLAIGQTDAVSALQVLDAYSAVANGGVMVAPKLVKATTAPDGTVRETPPSASHRVIPASVDHELVPMFEQVVDAGTGVAAAVPGYLVAGKTGTAQVPADNGTGGYIPGDFDATFVGFAPAQAPVLSAIVVLNHPTPIFGGAVSAPVFSQIMSFALHRYDVPTSPGLNGKAQVQAPATILALVRESA